MQQGSCRLLHTGALQAPCTLCGLGGAHQCPAPASKNKEHPLLFPKWGRAAGRAFCRECSPPPHAQGHGEHLPAGALCGGSQELLGWMELVSACSRMEILPCSHPTCTFHVPHVGHKRCMHRACTDKVHPDRAHARRVHLDRARPGLGTVQGLLISSGGVAADFSPPVPFRCAWLLPQSHLGRGLWVG